MAKHTPTMAEELEAKRRFMERSGQTPKRKPKPKASDGLADALFGVIGIVAGRARRKRKK